MLKDLLREEIEIILKERQRRSTSARKVSVDILQGFPRVNEDDGTATYAVSASDCE